MCGDETERTSKSMQMPRRWPPCARAQADGVPCQDLDRDCEKCEQAYPERRRSKKTTELAPGTATRSSCPAFIDMKPFERFGNPGTGTSSAPASSRFPGFSRCGPQSPDSWQAIIRRIWSGVTSGSTAPEIHTPRLFSPTQTVATIEHELS